MRRKDGSRVGGGKKEGKKGGKKAVLDWLEGGGFFIKINRFCKGSCLRFCKWDYFDEIN